MGIRSLVLFSFTAAALALAPSARADVPTGSTTSSTSAAGTGGAATGDPNCTVAVQEAMVGGTTCQTCDPTTSACSGLGSDYNLACTASAKSAVYCNGPERLAPPGNNVAAGCAVSMPGSALGGGAAGVLAVAAALMMRRRRRG